jgi:cytochrome c
VPSVSITELVRIKGDQFPKWKGSLVATSLSGGSSGTNRGLSLFRFHYSNGSIIYVEPIVLGWRMRDIVEAPDGRLVILTDDKYLLIVSNGTKPEPADAPVPAATAATPQPALTLSAATEALPGRGVFADKCSSCHGLQPGNPDAIAPALGCVVGAPIASTDSYAYSAGLKQRAGSVWDQKNLATYINNPEGFAPGAKMAAPGISGAEIGDVIAFLTAYRTEACR